MSGIVPAMNHAWAAPAFTAATRPGDQQIVQLAREGGHHGLIVSRTAGLWSSTSEGPPRETVLYIHACTYHAFDEPLDGASAGTSPAFNPG
jgi:hypothetical protein